MQITKNITISLLSLSMLSACGGSGTTDTANNSNTANNPNTTNNSTNNSNSINSTFRCESDEQLQQQMLALVNQARAQDRSCGGQLFNATTAVTWNNKLTDAARIHSDDMASNNFFAHQGSNGLEVVDRAQNAGYQWIAIGENLSAGAQDSAQAVQGWLDSSVHCVNIMNPGFNEMGVACAQNSGSEFGTYHTQVFGAQ